MGVRHYFIRYEKLDFQTVIWAHVTIPSMYICTWVHSNKKYKSNFL